MKSGLHANLENSAALTGQVCRNDYCLDIYYPDDELFDGFALDFDQRISGNKKLRGALLSAGIDLGLRDAIPLILRKSDGVDRKRFVFPIKSNREPLSK